MTVSESAVHDAEWTTGITDCTVQLRVRDGRANRAIMAHYMYVWDGEADKPQPGSRLFIFLKLSMLSLLSCSQRTKYNKFAAKTEA